MGQGGLEPPTPRLSSVCSNQLSYWPPSPIARSPNRRTHFPRFPTRENTPGPTGQDPPSQPSLTISTVTLIVRTIIQVRIRGQRPEEPSPLPGIAAYAQPQGQTHPAAFRLVAVSVARTGRTPQSHPGSRRAAKAQA